MFGGRALSRGNDGDWGRPESRSRRYLEVVKVKIGLCQSRRSLSGKKATPLRPLQRRICRTKVGTRTRQRRNQLHFKIRLGPGFLPLFRPLFCHPNHTAYHRAIACTNNSHTKTKAMAPTTHHGSRRRRPPTEPFQQHPGHEITPTGSQSPILQMSIIGFFFLFVLRRRSSYAASCHWQWIANHRRRHYDYGGRLAEHMGTICSWNNTPMKPFAYTQQLHWWCSVLHLISLLVALNWWCADAARAYQRSSMTNLGWMGERTRYLWRNPVEWEICQSWPWNWSINGERRNKCGRFMRLRWKLNNNYH